MLSLNLSITIAISISLSSFSVPFAKDPNKIIASTSYLLQIVSTYFNTMSLILELIFYSLLVSSLSSSFSLVKDALFMHKI